MLRGEVILQDQNRKSTQRLQLTPNDPLNRTAYPSRCLQFAPLTANIAPANGGRLTQC